MSLQFFFLVFDVSQSTVGRLTHMHIVRYYQATWSCDVIREAFALLNQKTDGHTLKCWVTLGLKLTKGTGAVRAS